VVRTGGSASPVLPTVVVDVVVVVVDVLVIDESIVLLVMGAGACSTGAGAGAGVIGAGVGLTSPVLVDVVVSFRTGMLLLDGDVAL
jgi:hypothetical protein